MTSTVRPAHLAVAASARVLWFEGDFPLAPEALCTKDGSMARILSCRTTALAALILTIGLAACEHHLKGKTPPRLKVVNSFSPITYNRIDPNNVPPEYMRTFKGQIVGFCCANCVAQWDRLTDEQRQERLDKAMSKAAKETTEGTTGTENAEKVGS
jgi:hypothetical protein